MTDLARAYHRQRAIDCIGDAFALPPKDAAGIVDAVISYAAIVAMGVADERPTLLARVANLRAALASIAARSDEGHKSHLDAATLLVHVNRAAETALRADDADAERAAHPMRQFVASPDGTLTEVKSEER